MRTPIVFISLIFLNTLAARPVSAQNHLIVDGTTVQLGGILRYDSVSVINGGRINVIPFDGTDRVNTGNLELIAPSIFVDATSSIVGTGAGYQGRLCLDGAGPTAFPQSGGRGGCSVADSGGGGAHFGAGGRGTKDCPGSVCVFPRDWEDRKSVV